MKNYRGYYIDRIIFNNEHDIDEFIKAQAIEHYKMLNRMFVNDSSMELNAIMITEADRLHDVFGLSYDEIEAIEIEAIKEVA